MPHKYGSTTHLIDNDNCESITTTTNSTKETSIYLDSDDFDVAFENTILRLDESKRGYSIFERHKILLSLILVLLAVASVFSLIAIKWHGFSKTDNGIPSSGSWIGITHSQTNEYEFKVKLRFESDNTFTGSVYLKSSESDFTRQNSSNLTGHWNGHSMKFKSGNYSGNGRLVTKNKIQGQWSDGTLQYSFQMTKIEPIVMLL